MPCYPGAFFPSVKACSSLLSSLPVQSWETDHVYKMEASRNPGTRCQTENLGLLHCGHGENRSSVRHSPFAPFLYGRADSEPGRFEQVSGWTSGLSFLVLIQESSRGRSILVKVEHL